MNHPLPPSNWPVLRCPQLAAFQVSIEVIALTVWCPKTDYPVEGIETYPWLDGHVDAS